MTNQTERFENFEQFWPHFMASHTKASTRWAHVIAVASGLASAGIALHRRSPWPAVVGSMGAVALALGAHPIFEGNVPENTGNFPWAIRANFRLFFRMLTGTLEFEAAQ
jgi:hypothetical protein